MSGTQTVLLLVVVPLAITLIVGGLAYAGGPRRDTRYRPGRPYHFSPVWYVANHRDAAETAGREALPAGKEREALPAATGPGAAEGKAALRAGPGRDGRRK